MPAADSLWYKDAIIYEAHVRAFVYVAVAAGVVMILAGPDQTVPKVDERAASIAHVSL